MSIINKSKIFFTSDTHFYHKNIIEYCRRPFKDLDEMHEVLINNWNKVVPEDGYVFHLGDFAFTGNIHKIRGLVKDLNGKITLIMGNHDYQNKFNRKIVRELFYEACDVRNLSIYDPEIGVVQDIFMSHYPHIVWPKSFQGSWHVFGHVHTSTGSESGYVAKRSSPNQYDVGVDNNAFTPISYQSLKTIITQNNLSEL